ncbi:MAG: hypothetical protein JWO67_4484 [Streptosporangiaceae bacterium]|nr:hypothetical protein [Streptosporangiaceae bacterium]
MSQVTLTAIQNVISVLVLVFVWRGHRPLAITISNYRKNLDAYVAQTDRELKVMSARMIELGQRADRNTEAMEHAVVAVAQLTARLERVERAAHHHDEMERMRSPRR